MGSPSTVPSIVGDGLSSESSAKRTKRNSLLNKFLSKTYHMVDNWDGEIVCWSNGGNAFTILDQRKFQEEILPKYFNHGKFTSFIRQLNFYGFVKLRSESDLQTHTPAVRFAHEFFRKGRPDLLHKITRSTAQKPEAEMNDSHVEVMQHKIKMLEKKVESLEQSMDQKIRQVTVSLTEGYMSRINSLEASYERLLQRITQMHLPMGLSLPSAAMTSVNAASIPSRNGSNIWAGPIGSPLLGQLDANLVSNFVRSNNKSH
ncbi:HSF-type DNA-binding protein [Nitzschia inconspicua]|uniref:HSF-type DNA-binding protein n=1 Tax=Nitzschia inconspicua TaxID=303405 RepID=A0A9K3KQR8_9STRA|nr:HSF-type DNA-binding protein [Nitzschia inconspicua]